MVKLQSRENDASHRVLRIANSTSIFYMLWRMIYCTRGSALLSPGVMTKGNVSTL
jgi:hypothetical protein